MAHIYSATDFDPELIKSRVVGLIGYGNQGHAHALNLRDSSVNVIVGSSSGRGSYSRAMDAGFEVVSVGEASRRADVIVLSLPDESMARIYHAEIESELREGQCLNFVHGFNIHFGFIKPPSFVDVTVVGPKGPGWGLRAAYQQGNGLAALVGVGQDATGLAEEIALSYAWGLGCARSMVMRTTFREETETDLFGEQAVLCGGIPALIKMGYETLVEAGYQPEAAYFETLHETKLIVDLLVSRGIAGMRLAISDTAEWGGYLAGDLIVNDGTRKTMKEILARIQDGSFAKEWVEESASGGERLAKFRAENRAHGSEVVGAEIRPKIGL